MSEVSNDTPIQDQGAPLTEVEKKTIQRLFSEPLEFPTIFRNWLKLFIETSGIQLPRSAIAAGVGAGDSGSLAGFPPGMILALGGNTPPAGSLVCNGQLVSRTAYASLFAAIGTAWGAGDGTTTFAVPDLRDRALYGAGSKVALGQTDGGALGTRGPKHNHTMDAQGAHGHSASSGSAGGHNHGYTLRGIQGANVINASDSSGSLVTTGSTASTDTEPDHSHSVSITGAGNHTHTISGGGLADTPAYAGVTYVITT